MPIEIHSQLHVSATWRHLQAVHNNIKREYTAANAILLSANISTILRTQFYVLLTLHPCIISQIIPARCTILFNIFIYLFLFFTCFGHPRAHHQEKTAVSMWHWYLSLCMGGVWSAGWIEIQQIPLSHIYSNFLLMMGTWMPETCREDK